MNDQPNISDAEWQVMHAIWQNEPTTSNQIIERLAETSQWTPGTVKTLLHRLVQKGAIDFQRKGNRYLYRSKVSEDECIDLASNQMLHTIFKGRPVPMLAYMVQSARLSGQEVETLQSMLAQIKNELPGVMPTSETAKPIEVSELTEFDPALSDPALSDSAFSDSA